MNPETNSSATIYLYRTDGSNHTTMNHPGAVSFVTNAAYIFIRSCFFVSSFWNVWLRRRRWIRGYYIRSYGVLAKLARQAQTARKCKYNAARRRKNVRTRTRVCTCITHLVREIQKRECILQSGMDRPDQTIYLITRRLEKSFNANVKRGWTPIRVITRFEILLARLTCDAVNRIEWKGRWLIRARPKHGGAKTFAKTRN